MRAFLRFVEARPLDPARPIALRALVGDVRAGHRLAIFAPGRIAASAALMKGYDGAAFIAERSGAPVTPVRLAGAERTYFSRIDAAKVGRRLLPKIIVTILPPERIGVAADLAGRARRRAAGAALYEIMSGLVFRTSNLRSTLFAAFEDQAKLRGLRGAVGSGPAERRPEPAHVPHRRRGAGAQDRRHLGSRARPSACSCRTPTARR